MRRLYSILYSVYYYLGAPLWAAKLGWSGNWIEEFRQRTGRYTSRTKHAVTNRHTLWLHGNTPEEVNLVAHLIGALEPRLPNLKMVTSTATRTGRVEMERKLPSHILKVWHPADRWKFVYGALKTTHPQGIVFTAIANLRPNFIWRAREMRLPVFLIGARPSGRAYLRFRLLSPLYRPIFRAVDGVACRDEAEASRWRQIGCRPEAIRIVGAFPEEDAKLEERRWLHVPTLLRQIGVPEGTPLLVAGDTQSGEEAVLAEAFQQLQARFPELFLILVPRQVERCNEVGRVLAARGLKYAFRKNLAPESTRVSEERQADCLIVNIPGEMKVCYEYAKLIFLGNTLAAGAGNGQDPTGPCILGKPVIFGPHMGQHDGIARALVEKGGAARVENAAEMTMAVTQLLADESHAAQCVLAAREVIRVERKAIEQGVDMILAHLKDSVYVKDRSPGSPGLWT